ncbi:MAG: hypothetical protein HWQ38_20895 [Nostoc sp. NMS7]|uniref:hypothetical protein n=1 Tax=uncultured Nostoc sp. TaxID=340711 RepID=UPI0035CA0B95|nr:hypothetical protein [Nostoc sp. NMS7]
MVISKGQSDLHPRAIVQVYLSTQIQGFCFCRRDFPVVRALLKLFAWQDLRKQ